MAQLITFEEALKIIGSLDFENQTEIIPLLQTHQRILQEDIYIGHDVPAFDRAAMDGYACKWADTNIKLQIIEEIPAGKNPEKTITPSACARIMTGAKIPQGADLVAEQEICSVSNNNVSLTKQPSKSNIQKQGEDMESGDLLLGKDTLLHPWHIAMIATAGLAEVEVSKQPSVLVVATGSELREPGVKLAAGEIYNSNAYQMLAQLQAMGITATYGGILKDDKKAVHELLQTTTNYDLVLLSGGVSVGDYDFIPETLQNHGYKIHFHGIQVKPGKRTLLAQKSKTFVIGLPGNPVSSLLQFEEIVRPFLLKMMGSSDHRELLVMESAEKLLSKPAKRMLMLPVIVKGEKVFKLKYNGSAHIHAFADANAVAIIQNGTQKLDKGDKVHVRLIS